MKNNILDEINLWPSDLGLPEFYVCDLYAILDVAFNCVSDWVFEFDD
jgi:hypothetical protein